MEEWINLFSSITSENPEESTQACNSIDQMISEFDINLYNAAIIVLMNDPIQYNTRHAAGIILGRALNQKCGQILNKDLEKFWKKQENEQMIITLKDALLKIINEDTDLLQNDCSWIISLIFQIEKSKFLPFISEILLKFDSIQCFMISATLLNNIFDLPFYKTRIQSNDFTELLNKVYPVYVDLLSKPTTELDNTELRILITETLLKGLSIETSIFNSEESITCILNALPQCFPIPNLKLYQNLNSILSSLVIHFYDLSTNFIGTVFEYTSNGLSCDDEDFILSSLQVWSEIMNHEITLNKCNKKVLGIANGFFEEFLNIFMHFGQRASTSPFDPLFREAYNVLRDIFMIAKIDAEIFKNYFPLIKNGIQELLRDQSNPLSLFLGMHLVSIVTTSSLHRINDISDFIYSEVFKTVSELFFNTQDQIILTAASWTLENILKGTIVPMHDKHEEFGSLCDFMNMALDRIEEQFKPDKPKPFLNVLSKLFKRLAKASKLYWIVCPVLAGQEWEHFFSVYFSVLKLWPDFDLNFSSNLRDFSEGINKLLGIIKNIPNSWPNTMDQLIQMLIPTCNIMDDKITAVQYCYLTNISYMLSREKKINPGTFDYLISILKYLFTMKVSTTYEISLDILTSLVIISNYNSDLVKLYIEFMEDGMASNDPNVIMQCAATATRFFNKMEGYRIYYTQYFQECFDCFVKSLSLVDISFTNVAVAYVIRAITDIVSSSYQEYGLTIDEFVEYAYQPFNNIITDYVYVNIEPELMNDLNNYYQEMAQAIFHAMAVFARVYLSKMDVPLQKSFLQKVFKIITKSASLIDPLSKESIRAILGSIHMIHKYTSKRINGYLGNIYVQTMVGKYLNYNDTIFKEQIEKMWKDIYGNIECFLPPQ